MDRRFPIAWLLCVACAPPPAPGTGRPAADRAPDPVPVEAVEVPTRYVADRFVARPVTAGGDTLELFTDTGGGLFLYSDVADSLGLAPDSAGFVRLPAFRPGLGVPAPLGSPQGVYVLDADRRADSRDGMLGQAWFAGRVWMLDYPARRLLLLRGSRPEPAGGGDIVPLGFQVDSTGARALNFPRIRVRIDGDSLDLLLDTGATALPTATAAEALGLPPAAEVATSFITAGILERWARRHPDWRVIPDADRNVPGMRMIRVPEVSVGGHTVGPVWFTERPDANFHEYMSRFMDRRVEGALGGSALKYFRVTVSYPDAFGRFERPGTGG